MIKKLSAFLVLACFFSIFVGGSHADEYSDLQKQLNKRNQDLSNTQSNLEKIKKDIASLSSSIAGTKRDLDNANTQVSVVKNNLAAVEVGLEKKRKALNYLIEIRNKQVRELYQNPSRSTLELFLSVGDLTGFMENLTYQALVVSDAQSLITSVNTQVKELEKSHQQLQTAKSDLEILIAALNSRYSEQRQSIAVASSKQASLSRGLELIRSEITQALLRKAELDEQRRSSFSGASPVPISPPSPGTHLYFFYGVGRYSAMGHGVGMSQWGAYGYAKNHGWSAAQILQKYYTGTAITNYPQPSQIRVVGNCSGGGGEQVLDFDTYLKGISELLTSWESILELSKAQVIAARTYAIRQVNAKGFIYGDTRDQCWTGNTSRAAWNQAVDTTVGQVLTAGGTLATTLYSASHGGHSEHNENIFQGWNGNGYVGYPVSHLRGVSDADSGGVGPYDNFGWNTKYSYTIGQIREILRKQGLTAAENAWIDSRVGTLTGLGIERGVSGRVAWVVLYGTKGTAKIPGMVFRASFNSFPRDGSPPVNGDDVMFSVNFSIGNQVK